MPSSHFHATLKEMKDTREASVCAARTMDTGNVSGVDSHSSPAHNQRKQKYVHVSATQLHHSYWRCLQRGQDGKINEGILVTPGGGSMSGVLANGALTKLGMAVYIL